MLIWTVNSHTNHSYPHTILSCSHKPSLCGYLRWGVLDGDSLLLTLFLASCLPSHTLTLFTLTPAPISHSTFLSDTLCLILTLHLWLANSRLISCHLPTELSCISLFSTSSRIWPSGQDWKMKGVQQLDCFTGIWQKCTFLDAGCQN